MNYGDLVFQIAEWSVNPLMYFFGIIVVFDLLRVLLWDN